MNKAAREELEIIRQKHGGFLRPTDIIKFARSKSTALHRFFEWDDGKAAEKFRLDQARELIQVVVHLNEETGEKVRAYVSVSTNRGKGGGYQAMADVVDDERLMRQLLADAKGELANFQRKYSTLRRIASMVGLFEEVDRVLSTEEQHRVSA